MICYCTLQLLLHTCFAIAQAIAHQPQGSFVDMASKKDTPATRMLQHYVRKDDQQPQVKTTLCAQGRSESRNLR